VDTPPTVPLKKAGQPRKLKANGVDRDIKKKKGRREMGGKGNYSTELRYSCVTPLVKKFAFFRGTQKDHYPVHKSPSVVLPVSQMNSFHKI
jgi:hypothetical protein